MLRRSAPVNLLDLDGSVVLDTPVKAQGPKASGSRRATGSPPVPRRELAEDFARRSRVAAASQTARDQDEARPEYVPRRFGGLRFRLKGGVPRSWAGRVFAATLVLGSMAGVAAVVWEARALLLHDPRLVLASSASVQITGNQHVTRAQLLSIFGGDVERNLLSIPMDQRRAELEALPWVEHAAVMRLLPNQVRVAIAERTPVAFVRQGSHIGLVDGNGVLLDMAADAAVDNHYSFPVVTGLSADDPLSTRAARMQLYERFTKELDSDGSLISQGLSEVDLSSPEDVKALIPVNGSAILVHFGQEDFLARYKRFEADLPGWKSEYPKLASVDMRYKTQVVLEMAKGSMATPAGSEAAADVSSSAAAEKVAAVRHTTPVKHPGKIKMSSAKRSKGKPAAARPTIKAAGKATEKTSAEGKPPAAAQPAWEKRLNGAHQQHLQQSFAVGAGAAHSTEQGPQ